MSARSRTAARGLPSGSRRRAAQHGGDGRDALAEGDFKRQAGQRLQDLLLGAGQLQPQLGVTVEIVAQLDDVAMELAGVFKNFRDGHSVFPSNERVIHNNVEGFIRVCELRDLPSKTDIDAQGYPQGMERPDLRAPRGSRSPVKMLRSGAPQFFLSRKHPAEPRGSVSDGRQYDVGSHRHGCAPPSNSAEG